MFLSTAITYIANNNDELIYRCLLDTGSQSNFVTKAFVNRLNLRTTSMNILVAEIDKSITNISKKCTLRLESQHNSYKVLINCLVIEKIVRAHSKYLIKVNKKSLKSRNGHKWSTVLPQKSKRTDDRNIFILCRVLQEQLKIVPAWMNIFLHFLSGTVLDIILRHANAEIVR